MKNKNNPFVYSAAFFFGTLAVVLVLSMVISAFTPKPMRVASIEIFYAKVVVSTLNMLLLAFLIHNYAKAYVNVKSRFSLGLLMMAVALLAGSFTANPLLQAFFGFRGTGIGPFLLVPELFTLAAVAILIWLSRE